jgi:hypothetical protein
MTTYIVGVHCNSCHQLYAQPVPFESPLEAARYADGLRALAKANGWVEDDAQLFCERCQIQRRPRAEHSIAEVSGMLQSLYKGGTLKEYLDELRGTHR